jgi:predicted dehydrogenase
MAVVGTGALGRHHARILSQMAGIELVAVADTNEKAAAETAQRCGTRATTDCRELLGQVEAVVVAVPTFAHRRVAGEFLAAGADVFVEKPIAAGVKEAHELVDLAARHDALLQVGHVERYNPALIAARPYLSDPKYIRAERVSPFSFRSTDIGVVHDMMIHDIDLVLDLVAAPVVDVQAFGVGILGELEDCVQARLAFANGSIADLTANRVSPVTSRRMQVWGAEGCVLLDFASREVVRYSRGPALRYGSGPLEKARQNGADIEKLKREIFGTYIEVHKPHVIPHDQLTEELLEFTRCVRTRKAPLVSGQTALAAALVADRILEQVAFPPWAVLANGFRRHAG